MCIPAFATLGASMTGTTVTAATASQLATIGTLTALQGATALGQAQLSIETQKAQAKVQRQRQKQLEDAERVRFQREMTANRLAEQQNNVIAAKELQAITKKAETARALAQVSAGEAGVTGVSVDALFNQIEQQQAEAVFALEQQQQFNDTARALGLEEAQSKSAGNLAYINKPIAQPDILSTAFNLAGQGLAIYNRNLTLAGDLGMDTFVPTDTTPAPLPEVITA